MNTSKAKRIVMILTVLSFLFVSVMGFSNPNTAFAQNVCSPATPITSPYTKDGVGDVCLQTNTLCDYINSWGLATLEINGTSYVNAWVAGSSIAPLNGTYTIRYVSTNANGHFQITAPCSGPAPTSTPTNTPFGPTATFTRTNTPGSATATPTRTSTSTTVPVTATRTSTSTSGPTVTPTRTNTAAVINTPTKTPTPPSVNPNQVVNTYGRLQISGNQLRDKNGNAIQLAGMSSHGLTWFPLIDMNLNNATNMSAFKQQINFNPTGGVPFPHTSAAIGNLVDQWHIQVVRASMFPYDKWNGAEAKSYTNNYPEWKWYNINLVNAIVQSAINENIYVIIDWHAGEADDQDPTPYWTHQNRYVQEFFTYMVDKWGSYPNVIYETVNSPVVSWSTLKTYNQNVINHIREREAAKGYAPNMILVGTPTWSQDIDVATNDPLTGNLIAYNYMWYAGTHSGWVASRGDTALNNLAARGATTAGQTLFMGEVGTSSSDGNGGVYYSQFNTLMEWAKTKKLSWLNWSIANKEESSAIFVPAVFGNITNNEIAWRGGNGTIAQAMASTGQPMRLGPWTDADLSCSGKFVRGWMLYNTSQPTPSGCW